MKEKVTLVVGADSMIGQAMITYLTDAGELVIGTTRRPEQTEKDRILLDLSENLSGWKPPRPVKTAYICAGVTRLDDCRRDPLRSARINVTGTCALAKALMEQGAFVVFLSTNQVFDGRIPHVRPDHPRSPKSEYGWQKAKAERILGQWPKNVATVRLSKVLGPDSLFTEWSRFLKADRIIRPFTDMVLSPVPLDTVVSALGRIGDRRSGGSWQISGERDVSYARAAKWGADVLESDSGLVQPWSMAEAGMAMEAVWQNTTMNTDRMREELGLEPPPVKWTIEQAFLL
ncbi:MAG: sugar nucleotide-binding protein [Deltaproteobacteria bacterium]|nr:sugar nucleotide-binding protein [Deltaproteobacteria bacterium]